MSRVIDRHRLYLSDAARIGAFERAVAETVRPGDVVLDLGSGTGILGLLACRAGASRVYAVDGGGMVEPARAIARANDLDDRIHVIDGMSDAVVLPERADVLLTDQIGRFGFDAAGLGYVADARRRLLKSDARLVPSRITFVVAPVDVAQVTESAAFWSTRPGGFDMSPLREMAFNSGHPFELGCADLLASPAIAGSADLSTDCPTLSLEAEMTVTRGGILRGIGGWFEATLSRSVTMSNSPLARDRIRRRNVVLPIDPATAVEAGDRVRTRMRILPDQLLLAWTVEILRRGSATPACRFDHSTLRGMLLTRERLLRTRPGYVPHLTERGKARLSVLTLCDGDRTLADVEREVYERHSALFANRAAAAEFVAEVVTGYSV